MKNYLTLLLVVSSFAIKAQDNAGKDSIATDQLDKLHIYIAPGYFYSQFAGTRASFAEFQVGLTYLQKVDIAFNYGFMLDNFQKQIIFPTVHYYDQKNYGVRAQYSFLKKRFRLHAGGGYQFVDARWSPGQEKDQTFVDHVSLIEIYGGMAWKFNKTFTLQGDAGYTQAEGVDLVGFEVGDIGGFKASIMLKIAFIGI